MLHAHGYSIVQDLAILNNGELPLCELQPSDLTILRALVNEIRNSACLPFILDQDPLLPVKNTFINFPAPKHISRPINSCPVFTGASAGSDAVLPPGIPSLGSIEHGRHGCKPCAWFHHPDGCRHAASCEFCHLCGDGELKKRKKEKQSMLKFLRKSNAAASPKASARLGLPPPCTPMAMVSSSTTPSTGSPLYRNQKRGGGNWLDALLGRKHF